MNNDDRWRSFHMKKNNGEYTYDHGGFEWMQCKKR